LCLLSALPLNKLHRAFPAAAQDYFFVNVPRLALAAVVVNALPFGRQTHVRQSLELCRQLLANPGNVLVLFPEGTRTATGQMGEFKPGIGLLVAGTTIPAVPCHLAGAFQAWPRNKTFPRPRRLRLRIGEPRTFATLAPDREGALQVAAELQRAVLELGAMPEKP
jgi:1-acyl-sn-glycerol-3-phosphate acyltransferase